MIRLPDRLSGGRSLQLRFMLMVVVGAVLFSMLGAGATFLVGKVRSTVIATHTIDGLIAAVERSLAVGAYAKDSVLLGELAEGLVRNEIVKSVEVRAPNGAVLARAGKPVAAGDELDPVTERRLISPFDANETVATLRLSADAAFMAELAAREAMVLSGFMVVQMLVVALLLYFTAAWLISGPIVRLAHALPMLVPGTEQRLRKPKAHRHNEIGLLVDGANQLLDAHGDALRRERGLRAEIEAMEAQYRQIFDSSSAGIFVLDGQYRLINSNPTVSRVVGMSPQRLKELQHENFIERVFGEPDKVMRMLKEAGEREETVSGDLALRMGDGQVSRWVHCLISVQQPDAGASSQRTIEGVIYDVTERRRAERRTRYRAEHDPLTGLKNRGALESRLDLMMTEARAAGSRLTVLCLDLDGFKSVNDQFGHQAGDQVLRVVAKALNAAVRGDMDLVGRVGGDEFLIALQHAGPEDGVVSRTAIGLIDALRSPILLDRGESVRIGVSIGIASTPMHARDRATLVAAADAALYEVKRSGKNSYAMALALAPPDHPRSAPASNPGQRLADSGFLLTDF